jgi:riboflavin biosynthesis pyrimidine reductase
MILPSVGAELDLFGLAGAYAYPRERWLRANFVSSADGAAYLDGRSGGLSSPDDMKLFGVLRVLADVVLVGAGTARVEDYKPARRRPSLASLRAGRPETATIALVTRTLGLNLGAPLFTETPPDARTIVITCAASDAELREATAKVADVIVAGEETVDLGEALRALHGRGLSRVLCEGGPHLFGDLVAAGLLDELCLSFSPTLAGPGASRIITGQPSDARPMRLAHLLAGDDGFLFFRYLTQEQSQQSLSRTRAGPASPLRVPRGGPGARPTARSASCCYHPRRRMPG